MARNVFSVCMIKNETGGALTFVKHHDYDGQIISLPDNQEAPPYPQEIPNGQWATFVHLGCDGCPSESIGAVVYHCKNLDGPPRDWIMSWLNIRREGETSLKVYTEIMETNHYGNENVWQEILIQLNNGNNHSEAAWGNSSATVDVVPNDDPAIFKGIIN